MSTKTINFDLMMDEFTQHLLYTAPIVETILNFLNARDLNLCARVCRFWASRVTLLKRKRKTRAWECLRDQSDDHNNRYWEIVENTKTFLQSLYTEPAVVFMMCQQELLRTRIPASDLPTNGGRSSKLISFEDYVRSLLPKTCRLVGIGSGGIVGTDQDLKNSYEVENSMGVSFLCLPKYSGVDVDVCEDIEGNTEEEEDDEGHDELPVDTERITQNAQQFLDRVSGEGQPPCKVLLTYIEDFQVPRSVGLDAMKRLSFSLIAGAYVDGITSQVRGKYPIIQLTAICGESVQIASVIIHENIRTLEKAEECIKRLKQHNMPEENSFAFMFACVGRGEGLYGEPDVESKIFRKHFPKTPLIGLFGNGEIGFEHCSREQGPQNSPVNKRPRSSNKLYHAYTTVLVLVSIT